MKAVITTFLLIASLPTLADSSIRIGNKLIRPGDSTSELYREWGNPNYRVSSEKTCNRIIERKKRYCSYDRLVWKQEDVYWLVQHKGDMIIKIGWTRFDNRLAEKMR